MARIVGVKPTEEQVAAYRLARIDPDNGCKIDQVVLKEATGIPAPPTRAPKD